MESRDVKNGCFPRDCFFEEMLGCEGLDLGAIGFGQFERLEIG